MNARSFSKGVTALSLILKASKNFKQNPNPSQTWSSTRSSISSTIISCLKSDSELFINKNKLKHLAITPQDRVYYVSNRSFRSRKGVPLICRKTILARCIVQDAHVTLGHERDVLQVLSYILAEFYITGVRKLFTELKKSCPACLKLVKKRFTAFKADVPNILKTIQPPFTYAQVDIFGPVLGEIQHKRWVLFVLCLFSRAVHLKLLHSYSAKSISRVFWRTFALRGAPHIIWIDAGLNITRPGKDLVQEEKKVISALNLKFAFIEFKVTLPKHYASIGAVERILRLIKNTVNKSVTGPNQLKMDDDELHTWLNMVIEKINN